MSERTDRNKALMRRVYEEMWNKKDPALAAAIFSEPKGVEEFVHQFLRSFPDLQHTVHDMITEGDHVAVRFSTSGTHSGPWMSFAATGRSVHYTGITWARIADGKIIEHQTWWDQADLIKQVSS
jgi:steroid delta-isomerase-like uncharacterized protein